MPISWASLASTGFAPVALTFTSMAKNAVIYSFLNIFEFSMKYIEYFAFLLVPKLLSNATCANNDQCDSNKGLSCRTGVCKCKDSSFYWNAETISCGMDFNFILESTYLNTFKAF